MSTVFVSPGWRMPRNANQSKSSNYSLQCSTGDKIDITSSDILVGNNPYTISFWFKALGATGTANGPFFSRGQWTTRQAIMVTVSNHTGFTPYSLRIYHIGDDWSITGSIGFALNQWHHVAITYDGNVTEKAYFNGVLNASDTHTLGGQLNLNTANFGLNQNASGAVSNNSTVYSDLSIFDYALSASQVATLWGGGTSVSNPMALPSPPKAYYPLGTSAWNGDYLAENNAIGDYVFDFPIAEQSVNISNNFENYTEMSLSTWVNFNNFSGYQYVFSTAAPNNGAGTQFTIAANPSSGVIYSYDGANLNSTGVSVALNTWNHILVTQTGTTRKVFINGQQAGSDITTSALNLNQGTAFIGKYHTAGYSANAKISNVQIFNTALPATDVATLYNYGSPIRTLANIPQNSNLKAWYKLDASEVYNSSTTEWSIDNNQNPSYSSSFLNFDGNDRIKIAPNTGGFNSSFGGVELSDNFTVSFWVNTTNTQNLTRLIDGTINNDNSLNSFFKNSGFSNNYPIGQYTLHFSNGPVTSTINDGVWHNLVFSYNHSSTTTKVYTDGIETYSNTSHDASTGNKVSLFCYHSGVGRFLVAKLSNISIWNTSLNASQAAEIYGDGSPKNLLSHSAASNLAHWYTLNNTSSGLQDKKGSATHYIANSGATEYPGFVNALAGDSSGMSQTNLVQSDLQTVAPYSKYAMNFDAGNADYIDLTSQIVLTSELTISCWVKSDGAVLYGITAGDNGSADSFYRFYPAAPGGNRVDILVDGTSAEWNFASGETPIQNGVWQHYLLKRDSSNKWTFYLDNVKYTTNQPTISGSFRVDTFCRIYSGSPRYFEGAMSNMAIWNTSLSDSQVREVYNQGLPGNLNSFSGTAPIHWWQLGEGSSYAGGWIFANEIGSINGEGQNIAETDLTNGVGTTANGVSSGMGVEALVSDAPYSTGNAMSSGMAATARGTDVP